MLPKIVNGKARRQSFRIARTLLILVPRASPQALLSHGFAAVIADHSPSTKSDNPRRDLTKVEAQYEVLG
jgi:hypothetical protein